jgi:hypothetical protein
VDRPLTAIGTTEETAQLERLLERDQYSLPTSEKERLLLHGLNLLTARHADHCLEYRRILEAAYPDGRLAQSLDEVPFLPTPLFKWLNLKSVPDDEVFKVMTSSGTTGQSPSRIFLDVATARLQVRALASIVSHYLGPKRLPMVIIDHPGVVNDRRQLSARGAGILGMLSFGRDHLYVLDQEMRLDRGALEAWLMRHRNEDLLLFGFTFMVWQYFCEALRDATIELARATLVHSGGWKKLADIGVTNEDFKARLGDQFALTRVHNFYGMVEQVGSVFFECPAGYLHPPNFADVLVRDPRTWKQAGTGQAGVIEVLSLLPLSYPGHALLTEDIGTIHGVDDCSCGRLGRRMTVSGRVPKAEIRGCSDTHVRVS